MALGPKSIIEISNDMVTAQNTQLNAIYQTGENMRNTILQENEIPRKLAEEERKRVDADIALIKAPYDLAAAPLQGETSLMEAQQARLLAEYGLQAANDVGKEAVITAETNRMVAQSLRLEKSRALQNDIRADVVKRELDGFLAENGYAVGGYDAFEKSAMPLDVLNEIVENAKSENVSTAAFNHLNRDLKIAYRTMLDRSFTDMKQLLDIETMSVEDRRAELAARGMNEQQFNVLTSLARKDGVIPPKPEAVAAIANPEIETVDPNLPVANNASAVAATSGVPPVMPTAAPVAAEPSPSQSDAPAATVPAQAGYTPDPKKTSAFATLTVGGNGNAILRDTQSGEAYNTAAKAPPIGGIFTEPASAAAITKSVAGLADDAIIEDISIKDGAELEKAVATYGAMAERLTDEMGGFKNLEMAFSDPEVGKSLAKIAKASRSLSTEVYANKPDVIRDYESFNAKVKTLQDQSILSRMFTTPSTSARKYIQDSQIRATLQHMGVSARTLNEVLNNPKASQRDLREVWLSVQRANANRDDFYTYLAGGKRG
jgi:hypothetical protein